MELDDLYNEATAVIIRMYLRDKFNDFAYRVFSPILPDGSYDTDNQIEPEDVETYSELSGYLRYAVLDSVSLAYLYTVDIGRKDDETEIFFELN